MGGYFPTKKFHEKGSLVNKNLETITNHIYKAHNLKINNTRYKTLSQLLHKVVPEQPLHMSKQNFCFWQLERKHESTP